MSNPSVWARGDYESLTGNLEHRTVTWTERNGCPDLACNAQATGQNADPSNGYGDLVQAPSQKGRAREIGEDRTKVQQRSYTKRYREPRRLNVASLSALSNLGARCSEIGSYHTHRHELPDDNHPERDVLAHLFCTSLPRGLIYRATVQQFLT